MSHALSNALDLAWCEGWFTDIEFTFIGEIPLHAHRFVLCGWSSVFRSLFTNGMSETGQASVPLDWNRAAFERFLRYLYTTQLQVNSAAVCLQVYELASYYDVESLCEECLTYLDKFADVDTALMLLCQPHRKIKERVLPFIMREMAEVLHSPAFTRLPVAELQELLKSPFTRLNQEEAIFHALSEWSRTNGVPYGDILGLIRFPLMSVSFLSNTVKSHVDAMQAPGISVLLADAFEYHANPTSPTLNWGDPQFQERGTLYLNLDGTDPQELCYGSAICSGNCLRFTGRSEAIINTPISFCAAPLSILFWARIEEGGCEHQRICSTGSDSGGWALMISHNKLRIYWLHQLDLSLFNISQYIGKWAHFAVTVSHTLLRCYVDGELKASAAINIPTVEPPNIGIYLGNEKGKERYFAGRLARFAISSKVLSPHSVLSHAARNRSIFLDKPEIDATPPHKRQRHSEGAIEQEA
eukprot:TRINITY_DN1398_c0_g1_i1.p1 TRINITY_DN1398_c0_g1~~TRINITY_DN1398_c0_g1_i1.p1  ORF type:complete len:470 (-),score=30.53 TRINITY_DN1398_c0_g1_i1:63-1472(-)